VGFSIGIISLHDCDLSHIRAVKWLQLWEIKAAFVTNGGMGGLSCRTFP
jgi:hypothetical protein